MRVKQCHKSPIWEWFLRTIYGDYYCFTHMMFFVVVATTHLLTLQSWLGEPTVDLYANILGSLLQIGGVINQQRWWIIFEQLFNHVHSGKPSDRW